MSEKLTAKQAAEQLLYKPEYAADKSADVKEKAAAFAEGYKAFLNAAKTEREAAAASEKLLLEAGYEKFEPKKTYAPGQKIYFVQEHKAVVAATIGRKSFEEGFRLVIAHIDSPRLDLRPNPLYEADHLSYFKTHYYGGIRKYQWGTMPLADADQISREILLPGSPLLPKLAQRFGADILKQDGTMDRRLLADRAFATPEGKAALDSLTHPEIVRRIRGAKQAALDGGAPLFVLDGAVIVGTAAQAECDRLCVVTAPFETSVARIVARDGISAEMAARRLNAQTPETVLTAQADYVLRNDADLAHLQAAAEELCGKLLAEGGAGKEL